MIVVSIDMELRSNLDLEIAYEFCMEIEPCAIGYRCLALVEIRTIEALVRLVRTESSARVFFHTNFLDFEANFAPWEHNTMPS